MPPDARPFSPFIIRRENTMTWAELHDALRLRGLLTGLSNASASAAPIAVTGIAYDSRRVEAGNVFVALRGQHADGADFVSDSIARGAVVVVSQDPAPPSPGVPWTQVTDARLALACLAAAFHDDPSRKMKVVGITGTNGKTTTAYLVASVFEAAGLRIGLLGTVAYRIGIEVRPATRTTPEAPDVQALLAEMVSRGCTACVMEVSSHALALRRVDGMTFAAAVFTNLTRDHLDFHADMEDYFQAKRRLFQMLSSPSVRRLSTPTIRGRVHWPTQQRDERSPTASTVRRISRRHRCRIHSVDSSFRSGRPAAR